MTATSSEAIDLIIRNATVVNHDGRQEADIAVRGGKIIGLGAPGVFGYAKQEIDARGLFALPGMMDPHVHLGDCKPFKDDIADSLAAIHGGITTVGNFIGIGYTHDPGSYLTKLPTWIREWEANSYCHTFFHAGITSDVHSAEMIDYANEFGITSFKYFVYSQEDAAQLRGMTWINDGQRWEGFEKIARMGYPAIAMVHNENMEIIQRRRKHVKASGRMDLKAVRDTRPRWVEAIELKKTLYLSEVTGAPLYAVHLSSAESVDLIAEARARGVRVVCETNPAYLTRTSDDEDLGVKGVEWPPLKDRESVNRLWKGLADGVIQTLGTDHCPITLEEKPDVWTCEPGYAGLETFLPVMLSEGVNQGRITLEQLVGAMSYNVAQIFGLKGKGRIAVGQDADMVLINLDLERIVDPKKLHYWHADFTLYDGWRLKGWPVSTILDGKEVVSNGETVTPAGIGRYLPRKLEKPAEIPDILV